MNKACPIIYKFAVGGEFCQFREKSEIVFLNMYMHVLYIKFFKKKYRHYLYLMILWVQFELYFQNLQYCRDLLVGNPQWQQLDHMPCPGLFQERKATNFFQVHHCINFNPCFHMYMSDCSRHEISAALY